MCVYKLLRVSYSSYLHVPASFKLAAIAARIRRESLSDAYSRVVEVAADVDVPFLSALVCERTLAGVHVDVCYLTVYVGTRGDQNRPTQNKTCYKN